MPSSALATSCNVLDPDVPEALSVKPFADVRVMEVIGVAVTAKGIVMAVAPLWLTVTKVVPALLASIKQKDPATVVSSATMALLLLVHVDVLVTSPPEPPLTRVALTVNCWQGTVHVPAGVVPRASSAEGGVTVMLPTEFGETKKPLQPIKKSASPISPHKAIKTILRFPMNFPLKS